MNATRSGHTNNAGQNTQVPSARSFVGTWRVTVSPWKITVMGSDLDEQDLPRDQALLTASDDETLTLTESPMFPVGPEQVLAHSAGFGVWRPADGGDVAFTFESLLAPIAGEPLHRAHVRASVGLDEDGQGWRGPYLGTITDQAGDLVLESRGNVEAARMVVEALDADGLRSS